MIELTFANDVLPYRCSDYEEWAFNLAEKLHNLGFEIKRTELDHGFCRLAVLVENDSEAALFTLTHL